MEPMEPPLDPTLNAMKLVSHPHNINYCNALSRGTATVDNDHKSWWLTRWKTKAPVTVPKFFPSFIGDSIVSTLCTLVFV